MFSYMSKQGKLALRLPPAQREVFLKKYNAKLCQAYGVVQPEYVEVPASLLSAKRELKLRCLSQTEGYRREKETLSSVRFHCTGLPLLAGSRNFNRRS